MKASNELTIRIDPNGPRVRLERCEGGIVTCKEISHDSFFGCIKDSVDRDEVSSGLLPQNCFHVSILPSGERRFCLWHPARRADISYYGTEYKDFPLPRLVFGFQVSATGKVYQCTLGVVEDERLSEKTRMYAYPFSNVGGFKLCTGNNALPTYQNVQTLATLPYFLLRLPNNNDSFHKAHNLLGLDHRTLLNHLKDKSPDYYYGNILVSNNKTLKDFISGR